MDTLCTDEYSNTKHQMFNNNYVILEGNTFDNVNVNTLDDLTEGAIIATITLNNSCLGCCSKTLFTYCGYALLSLLASTPAGSAYDFLAFNLLKDCGNGKYSAIDEVRASNYQIIARTNETYPFVLQFTDTNNYSPCDCTGLTNYILTARSTTSLSTFKSDIIIFPYSFTCISSPTLLLGHSASNYSVPSIAAQQPIIDVANISIDPCKYRRPYKVLLNYTFTLSIFSAGKAIIQFYKSYGNCSRIIIYTKELSLNDYSQTSFSIQFCDTEYAYCNDCVYYYVKVLNPNTIITYENKILLDYTNFTAEIIDISCNC